MKNEMQEFDIYSYINSKDVAEHCRNINHQFNTTEMAKLIYMSRLSGEGKMQGYRWLIENAPDDSIPNIYLHIPYFAFGSIKWSLTDEERQIRARIYKGRESVIEYLKQCTSNGKFIDQEDGCNNIKNIDIHIPNPFKVGDILKDIMTNEIYVVRSVSDSVNEISGKKSRSQFCLGLYKRDDSKQLPVIMIEVSDLQYCQDNEQEKG